jgi:hypothetical protein
VAAPPNRSGDDMTVDYFDRIETQLMDALERQAHRRALPAGRMLERLSVGGAWLRARPGLLALTGVLALSGSAAAAALLSAQRSRPLSGVTPSYNSKGSISVAGSHYEIELSPSLRAGTIGWCVTIVYRDIRKLRGGLGGGDCSLATPAVGSPLFASSGAQSSGGLWYVLAGPDVAAVRVARGPTVLTRSEAGLPDDYRAAVFQVKRSEFGRESPPQLTALNAGGQKIAGGAYENWTPQEQTRFWAGAQPAAQSACSIASAKRSDVSVQGEMAVTRLLPDPGIVGHAFLSCEEAALSIGREHMVAAILLDAKHPGQAPAALPYERPVGGHPNLYSVFGGTGRPTSLLARRAGDSWLVVTGTRSQAEAMRALDALSVGPIVPGRAVSAVSLPHNAECRIGMRALPGVQEVSQTAYLLHGDAARRYHPTHGMSICSSAHFYFRAWPIAATVAYPIGDGSRPAARRAVPGHPGLFTVSSENGSGRALAEHLGRVWLEISGGSGAKQREALLRHLSVAVAQSRSVKLNLAETGLGRGGLTFP